LKISRTNFADNGKQPNPLDPEHTRTRVPLSVCVKFDTIRAVESCYHATPASRSALPFFRRPRPTIRPVAFAPISSGNNAMRYAHSILFAVALFFVGCSDGAKPKSADDASATDGEIKKGTFAGTWLVTASRMDAPSEVHIAIVEISRDKEGVFSGKVLDSSADAFPDATLTKTVVSKNSIQLDFRVGEVGELEVHGLLDGDTIYCNASTNSGLQPVRLARTRETKISGPTGIPTEGAEAFEAARDSDDSVAELQQFAKQFNKSPTAMSAYILLLSNSKKTELTEAVVSQIVGDFIKTSSRWGSRMERNVRIDSAAILVQQKYLPNLAVKTLLPLEKELKDEEKESKDEEDSEFTMRLKFISAMARAISPDEETRVTGAVALRELHEENLLDHRLRVTLAKHHDKDGDKSKAMQLFAELAILPEGEMYLAALSENKDPEQKPESAEQATARLWKSINGKADGLDEFRDQVYVSVIHRMFESSSTAPPTNSEGKQIALCELFTGATCPPCVAADMATVGLEATYPSSSLIVLRYHQHIPGPDPLTNADSETRFAYYDGRGTPTIILNGQPIQGIAGPLAGEFVHSKLVYEDLRKKVDPVIDSDSKLSIQLSAEAKDGKLSLSAKVDGSKDLPLTARLRLVLAEDVVHFDASNGIRRHEMIVRYMPGGPNGIAIKEGRLSFQSSLKLAAIKQELVDYLNQYESGLPPFILQQLPNGEFPVRPMDLKPLHLIAFVQDDASQNVLQAAVISVSGKLEYPETATEPITPPAPDKDDANSPVEAPVPGTDAAAKERPGKTLTPKPGDGDSAAKSKSGPKLIPQGITKP
jgi:hypothetical protein